MGWSAIWDIVTKIQRGKVTPWLALRNTIGVVAPLVAGAAFGAMPVGLVVATGALNVSFSDSHDPYPQRLRRMLAASVLVSLAVMVGQACGSNPLLVLAVITAWAFAAGLLVALSSSAADLGLVSLVTLVVFAASPSPLGRAALSGLLAFGGGVLQTALALMFWPIRRYAPEQRALAELYDALATAARTAIQATEAPPASAETTNAQHVLAGLSGDRSIESERYQSLLNQAERMRLSLMMMGRLRIRLEREYPTGPDAHTIDDFFEAASQLLARIGTALAAGTPSSAAADSLDRMAGLAETMRGSDSGCPPQVIALRIDARTQMDALTGQLRSALDLAAHTTRRGSEAFERTEARQPWRFRLIGTIATLRANLSFESSAFRHAIRVAVCVAIGEGVARVFQLHRAYWLPMTIAIVLKPDFTATFSRGVLRLSGTYLGLLVATGLFHFFPQSAVTDIVLIAVAMFVLRGFGGANYGLFVLAVTALVVFLIAVTGVAPKDVMIARGLNTTIGGLITLLAYWVWPTWERYQFPEALAQLLDAYRTYFHSISESYLHPESDLRGQLEHDRLASRLARSNLEASVERMQSEPGSSRMPHVGRSHVGDSSPVGACHYGTRGGSGPEPSGPRPSALSHLR